MERGFWVLIFPLSFLSPLQPDPSGAPCGHHSECQAGSLCGYER